MKSIVLFAAILRIIIITALMSFTIFANAQSVAVNTTGNAADASAILDVSSDSKGILITRMNTAQRTGIPNPAEGLLVYDTDTKGFWYFSLGVWHEIPKTSGGGEFALPYSGSYPITGKIFSLTNADTSNGAVSIYGRGGNTGIGITPGINIGVWGDNTRGLGILGTSVNGVGTYGLSMQNHGVSGYTTSNSASGIYGSHADKGAGVLGEVFSPGIGVYGKALGVNGKAGLFEIPNSSSTDTVFKIENEGSGTGAYIEMNNAASSSEGMGISYNGNGYGLSTTVIGKGKVAKFSNENPSNHKSVLDIVQNGDALGIWSQSKGHGIFSLITSDNKIAVAGETQGDNGIAIHGWTSNTDVNGIGVKGTSASTAFDRGAVTAINNSSGIAVYAESMEGGMAVYGKTTKSNGAAIYGINNATDGQAIRGSATGEDGVAIYGEAGNSNSNSRAAYFRNSNSNNSKNLVQIDNLGAGNFLSLQNGFGDEKTTISKNGNIKTDGTVTVKNNKGIIRNTGSSQLRYEVIPVTATGAVLHVNESLEFNISFPTPFSATPAVSLGNVLSVPADAVYVIGAIGNVTSTGCKLVVRNASKYDFYLNVTWNLIAIGQE